MLRTRLTTFAVLTVAIAFSGVLLFPGQAVAHPPPPTKRSNHVPNVGRLAAGEQPLGCQPLVGEPHRVARDVEPPCHLAARWQALAPPKPAVEDGGAELQIDLSDEIILTLQPNIERHAVSQIGPGIFVKS